MFNPFTRKPPPKSGRKPSGNRRQDDTAVRRKPGAPSALAQADPSRIFSQREQPVPVLPDLPDSLHDTMAVLIKDTHAVDVWVLASRQHDNQVLTEVNRIQKLGFQTTLHPCAAEDLREAAKRQTTLADRAIDSRIATLLRKTLLDAANEHASDIHIHLDHHAELRFRVHGAIRRYQEIPRKDGEDLMRAIYGGYSSASDSSYQDLDFQAGQMSDAKILPPSVIAVRIQRGPKWSTVQGGGQFMVMRLLYRPAKPETSEQSQSRADGKIDYGIRRFIQFGYTDRQARILAEVSRQPFGLSIFSGPTGSAKSSALKTALEFQHAMYPHKAIYTIEDPAEYPIVGAVQISIQNANQEEARRTQFEKALRTTMRSDPDILMVGEIRDSATANTAFDAVLTGHQMWSTVHAQDAFLIVTRLVRFGLEIQDFLNPSILRVMVGQRLLPTVCPECALPFPDHRDLVDSDLVETMEGWGIALGSLRVANPKGCGVCHHTGVAGRVVIAEVVPLTADLARRLHEDIGQAAQWWREQPRNLSLPGHALLHLLSGRADPQEVVSTAGTFPEKLPQIVLDSFAKKEL